MVKIKDKGLKNFEKFNRAALRKGYMPRMTPVQGSITLDISNFNGSTLLLDFDDGFDDVKVEIQHLPLVSSTYARDVHGAEIDTYALLMGLRATVNNGLEFKIKAGELWAQYLIDVSSAFEIDQFERLLEDLQIKIAEIEHQVDDVIHYAVWYREDEAASKASLIAAAA